MSLNKQTKRSVLALSVAAAVGGFSVPSAFSQSVLMEEVIVTAQSLGDAGDLAYGEKC